MLVLTVLLVAALEVVTGQVNCPASPDTTTIYTMNDRCTFYRCENRSPVMYRCAYDAVFDDTLKRCVRNTQSSFTCNNAVGAFSDPGCMQCAVGRDMFLPSWDICRSGQFYVCRNGRRYLASCPTGYPQYNSVLGACSDRPDSLSLCTFNISATPTGRMVIGNANLLNTLPILRDINRLQVGQASG